MLLPTAARSWHSLEPGALHRGVKEGLRYKQLLLGDRLRKDVYGTEQWPERAGVETRINGSFLANGLGQANSGVDRVFFRMHFQIFCELRAGSVTALT